MVLGNLGNDYTAFGRFAEALRYHRRHLAICRELGDRAQLSRALTNLAAVRNKLGQPEVAIRFLNVGLALKRRVGMRDGEAEVLNLLGIAHRALGQLGVALAWHGEALVVAQTLGERPDECMVSNDFGFTLRAAGRITEALEQHRTALAGATKIRLKYEQARALDGIAACLSATDPEGARTHWQRALVLYREMGVPEQTEVERQLAHLPSGTAGAGLVG